MKEENIKSAFLKVKQDIDFLKSEIFEIKKTFDFLKDEIYTLKLHFLAKNNLLDNSTHTSTHIQNNTTDNVNSTHTSTVPQEIEGLKTQNLGISIGNEGVSTDRQTNRQTDKFTKNLNKLTNNSIKTPFQNPLQNNPQNPLQSPPQNQPQNQHQNQPQNPPQNIEHNITQASKLLDSLAELKSDLIKNFKKITPREMAVFSLIYQIEDENPEISTYKEIAKRLGLSQSSIRDYVQRMTNKGIPINKTKIDNKKIILSISPSLRKIASLSTLLQLRGY